MTAADREYEIEDDSPRLPSTALRTRPVRVITDEWLATHDAELVESIAAGFDARAHAAEVATRDVPRTQRAVDVVLAWYSGARFVRTHAAGPSSASVEPQTRPGGTPERIWWVHVGCGTAPTPGPFDRPPKSCIGCGRGDGEWRPAGARCCSDGFVTLGAKHNADCPATSPTGDPTDAV